MNYAFIRISLFYLTVGPTFEQLWLRSNGSVDQLFSIALQASCMNGNNMTTCSKFTIFNHMT